MNITLLNWKSKKLKTLKDRSKVNQTYFDYLRDDYFCYDEYTKTTFYNSSVRKTLYLSSKVIYKSLPTFKSARVNPLKIISREKYYYDA